ncbi:sterol 3-beta-glucosyltransferase UGT80A2 [Sarocladium implicatum]|nr:sterol 3-beta-glucosyltransferase UGT80A2 [Sarocladium implicatum]
MELLHHYTISTSLTLSSDPAVRNYFQVGVPQQGFSHPYVLHCILALAATHLAHFRPESRRYYYSYARAQHTTATSMATPILSNISETTCIPMYFFSILTMFISFGSLRDEDHHSYEGSALLPNWLALFLGVRTVLESNNRAIYKSPISYLFYNSEVNRIWTTKQVDIEAVTQFHSYLKTSSLEDEDTRQILLDTFEDLQRAMYFFYGEARSNEDRIRNDGRIAVDLDSKLYRTLALLPRPTALQDEVPPPVYSEKGRLPIRMNIVIQVVGSRGDVQPFVALGCELLKHGHRVRLATHGGFRDFILNAGLDFFDIGGDPAELMAYMVKNPGLIPSMKSLRAGDVQAKQRMMAEMLRGCWSSCISPDPISGHPFVAEAIVANPPSFAHIHCAQALSVPVHLMFTMPWTSTTDFRHPLANFISSSKDEPRDKQAQTAAAETANYVSYLMVEWLTWQGLGDVVNTWRNTLGLEPLAFTEGPLLPETLRVPFTYCWSPSLVPKPNDWGQHIDICGFFFREPPNYIPEPSLEEFLRNGNRPIYIGFGSIVIDDPQSLTRMITEAIKRVGARAIISKGWSNLGTGCDDDPDIFFLGDCPHEWLFQHVSGVVHHGGAGTTACGLLNGRPTLVIPFFGDQKFWGDMIATAGAGPAPIPFKKLTVDNLTDAIRVCLEQKTSSAAKKMANKMQSESGVKLAVANFHANLPVGTMRCDLKPERPATWLLRRKGKPIKLSKEAAGTLVAAGRIHWKDLKSYDTQDVVIDLRHLEPLTATASSLITVTSGVIGSAVDIVAKPIQAYTQPKRSARGGANVSADLAENQDKGLSGTSNGMSGTLMSEEGESRFKLAAAGSAAGCGGMLKHFTKGMLDAPLAVTEGFRNAPRLYGGKVYQPGRIDGVVSGGVVAGKNMFHGIAEGFGGLVASPVRGAVDGGPLGLVQGFGVGCLNMATKVPSGLLGLIFYPGQGLYKSIFNITHRKTRGDVIRERQVESERLAEQSSLERNCVLRDFETFLHSGESSVAKRASARFRSKFTS